MTAYFNSAREKLFKVMPLVCLILVVGGFTAINKNFLSSFNITNLLTDASPLLMVAGGLTFVLLLGCIDLSTGSIISCACVITGLSIGTAGSPAMFGAMLILGIIAGMLNGLVYTMLRVPTFVATLCTASIWQCAALLISGGAPKGIPLKQWKVIAWAKFSIPTPWFNIPIMFVIAIAFIAILYFIQCRTKVGKTIFAIGANEKAVRMMGRPTVWPKLVAYTLTGIGAAMAGMLYAIKLRSSLPAVGSRLTLMAIASVVLGGTTLTGGIGSVPRTIIGVFLVIALQNGLNVIGVDAFWQDIVFGLLVITAIILNADKSGRDIIIK